MPQLSFDKYEGLGNDFLVIETDRPDEFSIERARKLCDRHFGVGGDGVLLVGPASGDERARMVVINSDGSRPEMCGNGLRCVALHLARRDETAEASFVVQTDAGPRECEVSAQGNLAQVRTGLGAGKIGAPVELATAEGTWSFMTVSMGNPHAIRFGDPVDLSTVDRVGSKLSASIPGGSNVEFVVQQGERHLDVVVWERGVGRTLACGTGAAAVAVAAVESGRAPHGETIRVTLPGGPLEIQVAPESLDVELRGPARWVFRGQVEAE